MFAIVSVNKIVQKILLPCDINHYIRIMESSKRKNDPDVINTVLVNGGELEYLTKKADIEEIEFQSLSRNNTVYRLSVGEYLIEETGAKHGIVSSIIYCDTPENVTDWNFAVFVYDLRTDTHDRVSLKEITEQFDDNALTTFD